MNRIDKAIRMLRRAQSDLDMAHSEACYALARFDEIHADKNMDKDTRLAATSLRAETLTMCGKIKEAMTALPEAARQHETINDKPSELLPLRTAASMLKDRREGVVATSARHGRPILVAISCLMIAAIPVQSKADTVERVIDALVQIESSGRPAAIGDGGKAVGLLQLHPVAVREANRISGSKRWKLSDRTCPVKSRAMARTILTWHYQRGVTDPVDLACRWNRPFGQTTAQYRAKVRSELAKI